MTVKFIITKDINGKNTSGETMGTHFAEVGTRFNLTASTETTTTVPGNGDTNLIAVFNYTSASSVWVQRNGTTITLPSGTPTATTTVLNPRVREVVSGDTLRFITSGTGVSVSITYFDAPSNS